MNLFLLDTNICIYIINQRPDSVFKKFKKVSLDNILISSVTEYELRYGVEKSQKSEKNLVILNDFLAFLNIVPFDSLSSSIAASIRCTLEKKGQMIGPYDLLIASQAIANGYTLVTNNEKEFKRIKDLKIENWI